MTKHLCDTCRHARPAKRQFWQTADGREWSCKREYVCCDAVSMWTVEKREQCRDYERKGK